MAVEVAKGIHSHPEFKLGSIRGSLKADKRTITLSDFVNKETQIPASWDFDKHRKPFAKHMWGNDEYGDCELAGRANYLQRLQRQQTRTTPAITDDDVISLYKNMTGCQTPGDNNDTGLYTIDNLRQWRQGWELTKDWQIGGHQTRNYHISAFGMIADDDHMLRLCSYLFQGALLGCNMPITAQAQTSQGYWDVDESAGFEAEPGSWGGHLVHTKRFDADNVYVLTWGMEIRVTNAWLHTYCDERSSVVDSFDTWFDFKHVLDVQAMIAEMKNAGISVQT